MAEARDEQHTSANSFAWSIPPVAGNPLLTVVTGINGKLLESVATAQKDWSEFVHRRVKEDVAASQQLMSCQSLTDMQQIYSQYLQTAFEQYREQSERVVQRGKSMAEELAQAMESRAGGATQQVRH
jgi:cation transport regulator ChaB